MKRPLLGDVVIVNNAPDSDWQRRMESMFSQQWQQACLHFCRKPFAYALESVRRLSESVNPEAYKGRLVKDESDYSVTGELRSICDQ